MSNSIYKINDNLYRCECGKEFISSQSLNGHFHSCKIHCDKLGKSIYIPPSHKGTNYWENISEEDKKIYHKKSALTLHNKYISGELNSCWKGKHHSEETKQKLREIYSKRLSEQGKIASYNKNACLYFDKLNKENNWNLQHAENGGEIICCGFWLDSYDKNKNIVVEYDEPKHYIDVENNILTEKDIERQNIIIDKLNCSFFRYNEKKDILYKVNKDTFKIFNIFEDLISKNLIDFSNRNTIKQSLKKYTKYSYKSFIIFCKTKKELKNKILLYKDKKKYNNKINKNILYEHNRNILINACKNSNIDFSKFGWSTKFSKYLINRNELFDKMILRSFKIYYPEFFDIYKPFIRKNSLIP